MARRSNVWLSIDSFLSGGAYRGQPVCQKVSPYGLGQVMYESASCQAPCFFCFCSFRAVFEA
jgi:hypothetical protein